MGRRRGGGTREKKRKKVPIRLIERKNAGRVTEPYRLMEELVEQHHSHLGDAKIVMAWHRGWNQDTDGHIKLGMARKCGDLDRSLHENDFVIILNEGAWASMDEVQKRALVDHELCHCQVSNDTNGEPKTDEKGRTVYRIRRHDIEEFQEIVHRHGCYKADLGRFVEAAARSKKEPLFEQAAAQPEVATIPMKAGA